MRTDGSTETSGRPIVVMDGFGWVSPRGWTNAYEKVIHVGIPNTSNEYFIVTENNEFVSSANGISVIYGLEKVAALEATEVIIKDVPFSSWSNDAETIAFCSMSIANLAGKLPIELYIVVRADGSVTAESSFMAELLADWSDIIDIRLPSRHILVLKKDGTVLMVIFSDDVDLDVSQWQEVIAIDSGKDWCVGLKEDGALVFEGDHVYMNAGHSRK